MKKYLVLAILFITSPAFSQESCSAYFGHLEKTEINNDFLKNNIFEAARNLRHYSLGNLPFKNSRSVIEEIMSLREGSKLMDMGTGEARALVEALVANPKIEEGIGIAYERPFIIANLEKVAGRFRYLEGDYVENMARDGVLDKYFGKIDLIMDVYGPLSYSEKLPPLLQIYFDLLKPGGLLIFNIMTGRSTTPIMNSGIMGWLSMIPGIELVEVNHGQAPTKGGGFENFYSIKIKKASAKVVVPNNLETASYIPGNPPERTFISR